MELSKIVWSLVTNLPVLGLFLFQDILGGLGGILFFRDEGD